MRKIINCFLLSLFFALGALTLLWHNAAIADAATARRLAEERDELERITLMQEAAAIRFTLRELRARADALGFVPIERPRFVKREDEKPSLASRYE
jgi:hypothetical protein